MHPMCEVEINHASIEQEQNHFLSLLLLILPKEQEINQLRHVELEIVSRDSMQIGLNLQAVIVFTSELVCRQLQQEMKDLIIN